VQYGTEKGFKCVLKEAMFSTKSPLKGPRVYGNSSTGTRKGKNKQLVTLWVQNGRVMDGDDDDKDADLD